LLNYYSNEIEYFDGVLVEIKYFFFYFIVLLIGNLGIASLFEKMIFFIFRKVSVVMVTVLCK
jgi:hypothetical protein